MLLTDKLSSGDLLSSLGCVTVRMLHRATIKKEEGEEVEGHELKVLTN